MTESTLSHRILAFATKGAGSNEEARMRELLSAHAVEVLPFDRKHKARMFRQIVGTIRAHRPDLVAMEGTGLAGGLACLVGRIFLGTRYIVSSGDAVGPYVRSRAPLVWPLFSLYERVLCRLAAGFIGWTPYLVGRALSFGSPRAITAAGWAEGNPDASSQAESRRRIRQELGIDAADIIFGIVGSLFWSRRARYCYGLELVKAVRRIDRADVKVLVCGGGTGLNRLRELAGEQLGRRIILTGEVPWQSVSDYLAAMDVGVLPQTVDALGSFRYTTKISEYVACRLPTVVTQIPMAYDLDGGWMWRLPGIQPWDEEFVASLASLMREISHDEIYAKRRLIPEQLNEFDRAAQVRRCTFFLSDLFPQPDAPIVTGHYARKQLCSKSRIISFSHGSRFRLGRRLVEPYAGSKLLDYGCGDGSFLAMVADLFPTAVGADIDAKQNADCAARLSSIPSLSFVHTSELRDPQHERGYRVVTCMETLEHVPDDTIDGVIADLRKCVSPDGVVIISVPIEIGSTLPLKQAIRRIAGWRARLGDYKWNDRYTLGEMIRMIFARRETQIARRVHESGGVRFHTHKGFNWRRLRGRLGKTFVVRRIHFSPFNWSGGFLSSQAWFVCKPR